MLNKFPDSQECMECNLGSFVDVGDSVYMCANGWQVDSIECNSYMKNQIHFIDLKTKIENMQQTEIGCDSARHGWQHCREQILQLIDDMLDSETVTKGKN